MTKLPSQVRACNDSRALSVSSPLATEDQEEYSMIIRWLKTIWPCDCDLCAGFDTVVACVNCSCGLTLWEWARRQYRT